MIYGIRLEDYIIQRTNIVASLLKIISVLWFFRNGEYHIVGYFLYVQIINFLAALITLFIAKKRYNYDFKFLLKSIHFNKNVFAKTKTLALTSLYLTFTWILYYELDPTVIGKFLGPNQVAIYAIGLTLLSFFRSILGIIFSPFNARFNHCVGIGDEEGLKSLYLKVTTLLAPIVVFPIVTITLLASPLIQSWVGADYIESVRIAQFLVLCNLFAFIAYPTSIILMAKERIKEMYLVSTLIPIIYWTGIISTYHFFGLNSFAIFKFIAFVVSAIGYYLIMIRFLKIEVFQSIKEFFIPMMLPILFLIVACYITIDYLPIEKSKTNLLIVTIVAAFMMAFAFTIQYLVSSNMRKTLTSIIAIFSR